LDSWTAPNQLQLLGVVAHFTDHQERHRKALLTLRPITNHSGAEQSIALFAVLKDYGIVRKLGAIIGDNAGTNDTLCTAIRKYMEKVEGTEWDDTRWRLRCTGHIINLAVQAFLFQNTLEIETLESYDKEEEEGELSDETKKKFRLLGPLGQLHNIVVHIQGSLSRIKEFKKYTERLVPLNNRTR